MKRFQLLLAAALAAGAICCNLPTGLPSGSSSTTTTYQYNADLELPLLPETAWTANGGPIHPVCTPAPNPHEVHFTELASGVDLATASSTVDCCTCAARSRSFSIASMPTQGAHLHGVAMFQRGASDTWSVASMRLTVKSAGQVVTSRVIAAERRGNNNCAGSSELPEVLVDGSDVFDLDLGALAPNARFDEVDVDVMGYACGNGTNEATLESLHVLASGSSSSPPAPPPAAPAAPPPPAAGTPDLASSTTPSQWGSYATGTIGKDNSGVATIVNNGSATAKSVSVDIHTESNNPYGPVAPFRAIDARCVSASPSNNRYTCLVGDLAPGASTSLAFTFNSFSDTTVVVIATDSNGDANFADNRFVAHVYAQP